MDEALKKQLIRIAKKRISSTDVSHDFEHALRVLANAEKIAREETGDLDVIIPTALFHDVVLYPKNHPDKHKSQEESARETEKILINVRTYPNEKIGAVKTCILECSFNKGITPELKESKILQDADGLEAIGAISIIRTFSSSGQMKRPFYNPADPFCRHRRPNASKYALDLFYERLLRIEGRMHTKVAKKIARRRTRFLHAFLAELACELAGK